MNVKRAIADYFESTASAALGDRVRVDLVGGPGAGVGLRGMVAWDGTGWAIVMDENVRDWVFWKSLWHEVGHIYYGDVAMRALDEHTRTQDRALIAGGPKAAAARWDDWLGRHDADQEARADRFGLANAQYHLDGLNGYLTMVETTELIRDGGVKAANLRHGIAADAPDGAHKVVVFKGDSPAAGPPTAEFRALVLERYPNAPDWLVKVLWRRERYLEWLDDLQRTGAWTPATA